MQDKKQRCARLVESAGGERKRESRISGSRAAVALHFSSRRPLDSEAKERTKMKVRATIATLLALGFGISEEYRILGVFPLPASSHFGMFGTLMKGLAERGHRVEVIGSFPVKKPYPNYTDIAILPIERSYVNNVSYELISSLNTDLVDFVTTQVGNKLCDWLGHPKIQEIIRSPPSDPPYDLLITEVFATHCFFPLGPRLKVPTIGLTSGSMYPWGTRIMGNPMNLAFVPNSLFYYASPMTLWERLYNTVHAIYVELKFYYFIRDQSVAMKKYFGDEALDVSRAERALALLLVNSHWSLNGAQPLTQAVVEVGGLHVRENDDDQLSPEVKEWMDDSTEGFVYFTFGSLINIDTFPKNILRAFFEAFRKIKPIRVLMKVSNPDDPPPGIPSNVRVFRWLPQLKVLGHKNIRAFVTHGGLMGTHEAIHCAVPMIGIPQFSDQFVNVANYARKKIAVKLRTKDITEATVDEALNEILHNPVYKKSVVEMSKRFRDRAMSPMETAVWWIEYVARHGSEALRSPAVDLAWWQIELLDVFAILALTLALAMSLAVMGLRKLLSVVEKRAPATPVSKKIK